MLLSKWKEVFPLHWGARGRCESGGKPQGTGPGLESVQPQRGTAGKSTPTPVQGDTPQEGRNCALPCLSLSAVSLCLTQGISLFCFQRSLKPGLLPSLGSVGEGRGEQGKRNRGAVIY